LDLDLDLDLDLVKEEESVKEGIVEDEENGVEEVWMVDE
jgi:hypothetical protein